MDKDIIEAGFFDELLPLHLGGGGGSGSRIIETYYARNWESLCRYAIFVCMSCLHMGGFIQNKNFLMCRQ